MDIQENTTLSPPTDETEYQLKIIDHGHGTHRLSVAREGNPGDSFSFQITNQRLQECQWRDTETELPVEILRAVEFYGYHVTDVTQRSNHGLYENVRYLKETVDQIGNDLHDRDIIARSGVTWARESLEALEKLELLRAHLTEAEFDVVLYKAYETSADHPAGNLTVPTTEGGVPASLRSVVTLMLAYAQHDGYLGLELLDPDTVSRLVRGGSDA